MGTSGKKPSSGPSDSGFSNPRGSQDLYDLIRGRALLSLSCQNKLRGLRDGKSCLVGFPEKLLAQKKRPGNGLVHVKVPVLAKATADHGVMKSRGPGSVTRVEPAIVHVWERILILAAVFRRVRVFPGDDRPDAGRNLSCGRHVLPLERPDK